jgi:leader peptidase (prepilin peptidase) / N-methyltransferase
MVSVFIGILGLCVGSFLGVVVFRTRSGRSGMFFGRSECATCFHPLGAKDLIPLLSFLLWRGRCRYCRRPISFIYPLIELLTGFLFLLFYFVFGLSYSLLYWLPLLCGLVLIAVYDALFLEIPDRFSVPLILLTVFTEVLWSFPFSLYEGMLGLLIPVGFLGGQWLVSKGRWIGSGDIRLALLMGLLLGWKLVLVALFISYITGALVSLFLLRQRKAGLQTAVPFGVFLVLGTVFSVLWGQHVLDWYLPFL